MIYQTIEATNDQIHCGMIIKCRNTGTAIGNVTKVVIKKRYRSAEDLYESIGSVNITQISDFDFDMFDPGARSGCEYEYLAIPVEGTLEITGVSCFGKCHFDGISIADSTGTWISHYNPEYTLDRNHKISYINPLKGKYPISVSNADSDYETGSVSGFFAPWGDCGKPDMSKAREYKERLMAMLCNGESKLLKTFDGKAWIVSVDEKVSHNNWGITDAAEIKFNWTQIGKVKDPPNVIDIGYGASFAVDANGNAAINCTVI